LQQIAELSALRARFRRGGLVLTCLVGKNEAGKTAVLQAIAGLNPH